MSSIKSVAIVIFIQVLVGVESYMTDEIRMIALNAHNQLRSKVALGNAVNKNGTDLPSATNIYKMTWSNLVESYAQALADTCVFNHNSVNGTSNNLYVVGTTGTYSSPALALNASVYSWYDELAENGQDGLTLNMNNYNHFTQVAWHNSKEIGCAVANCSSLDGVDFGSGFLYTFVVCDYSPAGNYLNQNIYNPGTSASDCTEYGNSVGDSTSGLCQIQGVADIHA